MGSHRRVGENRKCASSLKAIELAKQRRFDEAEDLLLAALAMDAKDAGILEDLGRVYQDAGRLSDAERSYLHAVEARPESAEGHQLLGNLRRKLEKPELAIESLRRAVELDSDAAPLHVDLAAAYVQARQYPEAKQALRRAIELDPTCFDAYLNLGMVLQHLKENDDALRHLKRAIELRPEDPVGKNNLGVALSEQGEFAKAIECYEGLLEKSPQYVLAWNNLGNALRSVGRVAEAEKTLRRALELKPDYCEAHNNIGIIHTQSGQFAEAIGAFDRALLLRPDYPEAHANRGLVYLLMGNFSQGWADYEWRWQGLQGMKRRTCPGAKLWDGSPLAGKRLLLSFEQGLGDTFQFVRYAKELKDRGATVVLECQPNMRQILSRTPGIDEVVVRGTDRAPTVDFYVPLLSLPGLCQTNLDNLPRRVPYISTDHILAWEWKQRLATLSGFRIGIVWQGNPQHKGDRTRSVPLRCFAPIADVPGVTLVTLQKNFGVEQIERLDGRFKLEAFDGVAEDVDGWLRTAAIIANLDLVISADTSVAHLAGAMGVPVWVAIPTSPDWRWLLEREDTPWYPTMRLFRQKMEGDWDEVFTRMADALRDRLNASAGAREPGGEDLRRESQSLVRKAGEHLEKGELVEAQLLLERAIQLDGTNASAHQDLGVSHARQGRIRQAIPCFQRALELTPDAPSIYGNLGLACYHAGQLDEAVSHLRKAVWLGAGSADVHKNLARALAAIPDPAGAEEAYWAALRLKPDDVESHYQLSRTLLVQGKFEQGWLEHEWRRRWRGGAQKEYHSPRWCGQPLAGKRLLLIGEHDARETLLLLRYAHVFSELGAMVALHCQRALVPLLRGTLGIQFVAALEDPTPHHDYHIRCSSIPATVGTRVDSIPADRPYLGIESAAAATWRERLKSTTDVRIGLSRGRAAQQTRDPIASTVAVTVAELSQVLGVSVVGLEIPDDLADDLTTYELACDNRSLAQADTASPASIVLAIAAVVRHCGLIVSTDTVVLHIAGAMGIPALGVLPAVHEPYWLMDREDSPWYPTVRLLRQRPRERIDDFGGRLRMAVDALIRRKQNAIRSAEWVRQ